MLCLRWRPHYAAPTDDWGKNEYLEEIRKLNVQVFSECGCSCFCFHSLIVIKFVHCSGGC